LVLLPNIVIAGEWIDMPLMQKASAKKKPVKTKPAKVTGKSAAGKKAGKNYDKRVAEILKRLDERYPQVT